MGFDISKRRVDHELAENGYWFIADEEAGAKIKIRSNASSMYHQQMRELGYQKELDEMVGKGFTVEEDVKLTCKILANCAVLDWEGIEDDGVELKYSPEVAEQLLYDVPEMRAYVSLCMQNIDTFRKNKVEKVVKN